MSDQDSERAVAQWEAQRDANREDGKPDHGDMVNDQILDEFGELFNETYKVLEELEKRLGASWHSLTAMQMPLEYEYIKKCATAHWLYKRKKGIK